MIGNLCILCWWNAIAICIPLKFENKFVDYRLDEDYSKNNFEQIANTSELM